MKVYVIQNKNGIMMNVVASLENYMIGVLVKMIVCGILVHVTVKVIRHVKGIDKLLDIKSCPCEKRLFGKLALAYEDEMLNTTETSLVNEKLT